MASRWSRAARRESAGRAARTLDRLGGVLADGAFTAYGAAFEGAEVRFSFAGSDELAAQIRQGVKPDVFAAANTELPGRSCTPRGWSGAGRVRRQPARDRGAARTAGGRRAGGPREPGHDDRDRLAEVPIGSYTREVLDRLGAGAGGRDPRERQIEEPDVKGIVGKLRAGRGRRRLRLRDRRRGRRRRSSRAIALPARLQPQVAYAVAVVTGAPHPAPARAFVDGPAARSGAGRRCSEAGFGRRRQADERGRAGSRRCWRSRSRSR